MKKEYISPEIDIVRLKEPLMQTTDSTGDPNGYDFDAKESTFEDESDLWAGHSTHRNLWDE